jgi:uroporphyrinogen decarboxylase
MKAMQDQMTPVERGTAIAQGLEADRLPCNPNIANGVARVYGCKISEFNHNPKAVAEAQVATYRKFGCDGLRIFTDLFVWAEAMGSQAALPDDDTADLAVPAISSVEEISRLQPANPYKDGRLPVLIEAMKYLAEMAGGEVGCSAGVAGAFTNAFFLFGVNETLRLIHKNPEAVHELSRVSLETCKAYVKAALDLDIGFGVTISEPMSSCTVVSPAVFRKFSLPYLKELVDFIKGFGVKPVIHICGQTDKIWNDVADLGIAGMSIDNVASLKDCCKTIGHKTKIMGNVDPGGVMYSGNPQDIRRKTLECIRDAYDSPQGYVVMSGCSLPVDTPFENIQTMMDTVRDVGYPVSLEKVEELLSQYAD